MGTTVFSKDLNIPDLPALWPPPWPVYSIYAEAGGVTLGWWDGAYRIYRYGKLKTRKDLARFPLNAEGWAACWIALTKDYARLSWVVAQRAKKDGPTARRRSEVLEAEASYKKELSGKRRLTFVPRAILLGGHGYQDDLLPSTVMDLYFTDDGFWGTRAGQATPVIRCPYSEIMTIEFDGPGRVTKGGRFIGGGFGLIGAAEGMAIAAVLNSITTKSEIRSLIRWESLSMEAFFFTDTATPGDLRINFSPVLGRIKHRSLGISRSGDQLDRLERLATLHREGSLTDDEFTALKQQLIDEN